jgi:uncharacterized membrane protein
MAKSRLVYLTLCLTLVLTLVLGFMATTAALAQDETTTPTATATPEPTTTPEPTATPEPAPATTPTGTPASLKLESTYPSLSADSGQSFTFDFDIKYSGDRQLFNLVSTTQPGWDVTFTSSTGKTITAVQLGPVDYTMTEPVKVNMTPSLGQSPEPGEYPLAITVSSGTLSQTINLKATVKAKFSFEMGTPTGNLNTDAVSGKVNHTTIQVRNTGSAAIDKLAFTATNPDGWIVTFSPTQIDSVGSGQTQQVDVSITPPGGKTVAGDYMINITANNGTLSKNLDLRVTVSTPTIWGFVGIIIVVVVIAGLAVLFIKLGRR